MPRQKQTPKLYKRIRELREDNGYKQKQVAFALGISQRYYSNLENGDRVVSAQRIQQLAEFFGVSSQYILEETDKKK